MVTLVGGSHLPPPLPIHSPCVQLQTLFITHLVRTK
jgi:hypothetical protein